MSPRAHDLASADTWYRVTFRLKLVFFEAIVLDRVTRGGTGSR